MLFVEVTTVQLVCCLSFLPFVSFFFFSFFLVFAFLLSTNICFDCRFHSLGFL